MINVTEAFLPPLEKYQSYVQDIFERGWLTNNGPLLNQLELRLKKYLNGTNILILNNGTVAIQMAIRALELSGEIITTPFSYVATTSSIVWENCRPVFVDIHPDTFNINADLIEAAITEKTTAILATHVFGNPCDINAIQAIADKYNLKVVYDAAHAFGTVYNGQSIFNFGDISTASFHATKLFHTSEGGAVFTGNQRLYERLSLFRNFGHTSPTTFHGPGINAKNSEFHAAMGLCVLDDIDEIQARRKSQWQYYYNKLKGKSLGLLTLTRGTDVYNHSYFPVVFLTEEDLLNAVSALELQYIYPRRYFYPSLNKLNYTGEYSCPVSESIASRILCLPLYHQLKFEDQDMIIRSLNSRTAVVHQ